MRVALLGGATAAGVGAMVERRLPQRPPWVKPNYRGRSVSLATGPAAAAAATLATLLSPTARRGWPAVTAAGALGWYDDVAATTHAKGLRGHLDALRRGEVTSGATKLAGLVVAGAYVAGRRRPRSGAELLLDTGLVAGAANLVNLLDLRPGRALKASLLVSGALLAAPDPTVAAGVLGASAALLAGDLAERTMLGDCGANALGAALGLATTELSRPTRALLLASICALTLASERVSFSAVIDANRVLAAVDGWGRPAR